MSAREKDALLKEIEKIIQEEEINNTNRVPLHKGISLGEYFDRKIK